MPPRILDHGVHYVGARLAGVGQQPGIVVRRTAEHHASRVLKVSVDLRPRLDAAVDDDPELRKLALQPVDVIVLERRDLAVLLRRESLQYRVARVDDERAA